MSEMTESTHSHFDCLSDLHACASQTCILAGKVVSCKPLTNFSHLTGHDIFAPAISIRKWQKAAGKPDIPANSHSQTQAPEIIKNNHKKGGWYQKMAKSCRRARYCG